MYTDPVNIRVTSADGSGQLDHVLGTFIGVGLNQQFEVVSNRFPAVVRIAITPQRLNVEPAGTNTMVKAWNVADDGPTGFSSYTKASVPADGFPAETNVTRSSMIVTSCEQPIRLDDSFGAVRVSGFETSNPDFEGEVAPSSFIERCKVHPPTDGSCYEPGRLCFASSHCCSSHCTSNNLHTMGTCTNQRRPAGDSDQTVQSVQESVLNKPVMGASTAVVFLVLVALTVCHYRKDASLRRQVQPQQHEQTVCDSMPPSSTAFSSSNILDLQRNTDRFTPYAVFQNMDSFMSNKHHEYLNMWDWDPDTDADADGAPALQMSLPVPPLTGTTAAGQTVHEDSGDSEYLAVGGE